MKDDATGAVEIAYRSSCLTSWLPPIQTKQCHGLKIGDVVTFTADIVVTSCPQNKRDWKQIFQIYPVGVNENLIIDLEMLCSCPCENPDHPLFEFNSSKCSGFGTYKCGICECDEFHNGPVCEKSV